MTTPADRLDPRPLAPGTVTSAPANGAAAGSAVAARERSPAFQRMLESLERLRPASTEQPPVDDAESLRSAMTRADDDYEAAMALRRRLEQAFQRRLS